MSGRRLVVILLAFAALSGTLGCVYYNGMYNANRLARAAPKAQTQGGPKPGPPHRWDDTTQDED